MKLNRSTDPEAERRIDPWRSAMLRGDFEAAWRISDQVLRARIARGGTCFHWPRHLQYVWRGEPLEGRRVLVRCYHGLGDTLQFARFFRPLRSIAAHVRVWAQPELLGILPSAGGIDHIAPLHDGAVDAEFDVDIELMEIPHALRVTLATLPREVPYLSLRRMRRDLFAERRPNDEAFNVGLVWQSGEWDDRRSVPLRALTPLAAIPGIRLYSLQRGSAQGQAALLGASDISNADVEVTAGRMQAIDLIVAPDTMVAHLAGALGLPVFTLLHADCDWRWMTDRSDSPWYPTMRLFRQPRPGDWAPAIAQAAAAVAEAAEAKTRARRSLRDSACGNELTIPAFGQRRD